ncbi:HD domain-containing protein [Lentisphaerota bacterium ZTH]|nr:HD domain-containing protein [Lentisphaerota bacterium]WET06177.1 HD domain-containing protein [Lentisphaerota bacterium ZTH]
MDITERLKSFFHNYVDAYLTGDKSLDRNIMLKKQHSLMVHRECRELAAAENFSEHETVLAEIAGLYHDIGRFEQLKRYNTLVDFKSVNHGEFGADILEKDNILNELEPADAAAVINAVRYHNSRDIPDRLTGLSRFLTRVVRDADKLDIYRVVMDYYREGNYDKTILLNLSETAMVSPAVFEAIKGRQNPLMSDMKTITDFKLSKLCWFYDLNFDHSLREIRNRGIDKKLFGLLPELPEIKIIRRDVNSYMDARLV